jgi:hypothetical protein
MKHKYEIEFKQMTTKEVDRFYKSINKEIGSDYKFQYDITENYLYKYWIEEAFRRNYETLRSLRLEYELMKQFGTNIITCEYKIKEQDPKRDWSSWNELVKGEEKLNESNLDEFIHDTINKFKGIRKEMLLGFL